MMTNEEILQAALRQSAIDANCSPDDFLRESPVIVESKPNDCARKYLDLPLACDLISYGNNIVASIQPQYRDIVAAYIQKYPVEHCFETPNMHVLNDAFLPYNMQVCFMAEYFLPDVRKLAPLQCGLQTRLLHQEDFAALYLPQWENALCEKRKHLDVLGVGAYDDDGQLVGLAACSADCESMWQIGVDVLPRMAAQGNCVGSDLSARAGNPAARQSPVLLLRMVQPQIGRQCTQIRFPSGLGRNDRQAAFICGAVPALP